MKIKYSDLIISKIKNHINNIYFVVSDFPWFSIFNLQGVRDPRFAKIPEAMI